MQLDSPDVHLHARSVCAAQTLQSLQSAVKQNQKSDLLKFTILSF
jgi:hypothetical protein